MIRSQSTVTGTTERISGMSDFGGGEMLPKLAVAVVFVERFALLWRRRERLVSMWWI